MEKENIMGTLPVKRLLLVSIWPMVLSMLIQNCYNIIDSMFVAKISPDAFLALSLVYPVQTMMIALNVGIGVGINAMLSRHLGEGNREEANAVANHGYLLYFALGVLYALFGLFFARPFLEFFSNDAIVVDYGVTYLRIVTIFAFGVCLQFAGERMMQATGNPIWNMYIQASGAVINVILDPILIFGLFGFPELGIAGAAVATVVGQWCGALIGVYLVARRVTQIDVSVHRFRLRRDIIFPIFRIALPAMVMQSLATIMSLCLNKAFSLYSDTYVSVLGAYFKIQNFVYLVVYSLANVIVPIISYNCGARQRRRVEETIRLSLLVGLGSACLGMVVLLALPEQLLGLFNLTAEAMTIGVPAMRIVSVAFLAGSVSFVLAYTFQAVGCNSFSLGLSLLRQIVVLLPLAALLLRMNPALTWWAFPVTEYGCLIVAAALFRRAYHMKIVPLGDGNE